MDYEATQLLERIGRGDAEAASKLLPLVYDELRKLAASRMRRESVEHTLEATALVHEAYVRLVGPGVDQKWQGRAHFFAAAAVAMRRILVESARRKKAERHGGGMARQELAEESVGVEGFRADQMLELDEALKKLAATEPELARLVELRFFTGLNIEEAAQLLGISERTAKRNWTYARAFLRREMEG